MSNGEHRFDDAAAIAGLKSDVRGLLPDAIRTACPHFASWLAWMESLGEPEDGAAAGDDDVT